jgi:hypothetical protein
VESWREAKSGELIRCCWTFLLTGEKESEDVTIAGI